MIYRLDFLFGLADPAAMERRWETIRPQGFNRLASSAQQRIFDAELRLFESRQNNLLDINEIGRFFNLLEESTQRRFTERFARSILRFNCELLPYDPDNRRGYVGPALIDSFGRITSLQTDAAVLVDWLREPGCIAELRDDVLWRLEQIAYPQETAAILAAIGPEPTRPIPNADEVEVSEAELDGYASALKDYQARVVFAKRWHRRFRTNADVVAWLEKHHPQIDLAKRFAAGVAAP